VIWETLRSEYAGAELVQHRQARIIYGLLIVVLAQRQASALGHDVASFLAQS
jgi:hypothetical protein